MFLGRGEKVLVESNRGTHASKHPQGASICQACSGAAGAVTFGRLARRSRSL
jgi:hypothetical protein